MAVVSTAMTVVSTAMIRLMATSRLSPTRSSRRSRKAIRAVVVANTPSSPSDQVHHSPVPPVNAVNGQQCLQVKALSPQAADRVYVLEPTAKAYIRAVHFRDACGRLGACCWVPGLRQDVGRMGYSCAMHPGPPPPHIYIPMPPLHGRAVGLI